MLVTNNQAVKLHRIQEYTDGIILAASRGQRCKILKYSDIPADIIQAVIADLAAAEFIVITKLIDSDLVIEINS